jgi:alpha-mannosidase
MKRWWAVAAMAVALAVGLTPVGTSAQAAKTTLYLVATAHLDSQWNWTVQDSIRDHIPKTFHTNFEYFEKYPDYKFSWEGAIHYMWFKEYHPDEWAKVQQYVAADRWRLAGSWIDAVDTNMPSPESLFRQALYAQRFFREEFKKEPKDIYLPDCFGFGFALPSIAAHSGLIAFSTQKLTWGRPIPFPIGRWKGVDGSEIVAELNPGGYGTRLTEDITLQSTNGGTGTTPWLNDPTDVGSGDSLEFRYFGTGDTGGGPTEPSVQFVQKALATPPPNLTVKNTSPDQLAKDLTPAQRESLPIYNDELILKTHGTGCYTSQAAMKRFNRTNELLADAAEKSGVAALYLSGEPYPTERLRDAWIRFLWHQFHDDLTGTCIPQAYQFSWNDEIASLNQFAAVLTSSASAVASLLDTSGTGTPLVVYNPVSMPRREPVEAILKTAPPAAAVSVVNDSTGEAVPAQIVTSTPGETHVVFRADVPSMGYAVYHVKAAAAAPAPAAAATSLKVTASTLENNRIRMRLDENGDIASIYDKDAKHELLSAPIMLELRDNPSPSWPAWEVLYETVQSPAREYVANPTVKIIERGPARAGLEITRKAAGSTFVQRVRLSEGGDRIEVENLVDWRSPNSELKVSFPLTASNPKAIYDLGLGTIARTNNEPDKYEVPAQKWADIDDASGTFGVGIINDSKYGWDKPNDNTIRLTLLHTPRPNTGYTYQSSNDLGHHRFVYAIAGHAGDWRQGRMPVRATALNQPLVAFQTSAHSGALGREYSMATILSNGLPDTSGQVAIVAMKKAEDSDEAILRVQERYGQPAQNVTIRLGVPILRAREVNAAEEEVGPFTLPQANRGGGGGGAGRGGGGNVNVPPPAPMTLQISLSSYQPRALALTLQNAWDASASFEAFANAQAAAAAAAGRGGRGGGGGRGGNAPPTIAKPVVPAMATVTLPFNLDGVSSDTMRADGDFDGKKHTIPAELFPRSLQVDGVPFAFGPGQPGAKNILVPSGQTITLPPGNFNRVYVLADAIGGDLATAITLGGVTKTWIVREWQGPIGQWWSRLTDIAPSLHEPFAVQNGNNGLVVDWDPKTGVVSGIDKIHPAFVKRDEVAWIATHRHDPNGNEPYVSAYVFKYGFDLPAGTREIKLPNDSHLRIFAISVVDEANSVTPAWPLYLSDFPESGVTTETLPANRKQAVNGKGQR